MSVSCHFRHGKIWDRGDCTGQSWFRTASALCSYGVQAGCPKRLLIIFESEESQPEVLAQNVRHHKNWEKQGGRWRVDVFNTQTFLAMFFCFNFRLFVLYFFSLQIVLCYCYPVDNSLHSNKTICDVPYMSLYNYNVAVQNWGFFFCVKCGEREGGSVKSNVVTIWAYCWNCNILQRWMKFFLHGK